LFDQRLDIQVGPLVGVVDALIVDFGCRHYRDPPGLSVNDEAGVDRSHLLQLLFGHLAAYEDVYRRHAIYLIICLSDK
jgi:hypothetical protein